MYNTELIISWLTVVIQNFCPSYNVRRAYIIIHVHPINHLPEPGQVFIAAYNPGECMINVNILEEMH